ncbi:MAG: hypothetical protein S4CHLAM7_14360 [Chlamydiae bacterium]|nr:hypothetical protein [Chlamydiota bacterium]
MEMLLVEKISIDFWRLKRVVRFETGCVKKFIQDTVNTFYSSWEKKSTQEIKIEINNRKNTIEWNTRYIKCLENGLVTFDQEIWKNKDIESDIIDDFYQIAKNIDYDKKTKEENSLLYKEEYGFKEIKNFIKRYGYSTQKEISCRLIELLLKQNEDLRKEICDLETEKEKNKSDELLNAEICAIPEGSSIDKVMKYETSIQRSIYQNLLLLNKLQEAP